MKILFNGCSWTRGAELENIEEERFATLVCRELKAECDMKGAGGRGNHRITRTTLDALEESSYDLAVIQLSQPSRAEFYRDGQYDSVKWHGIEEKELVEEERKNGMMISNTSGISTIRRYIMISMEVMKRKCFLLQSETHV